MPRNRVPIRIRGAASAPAAPASVEDVKRAFYENASTPATQWITEMQLDPPQLIVCDDATSNLYRVPMTINGSDITFGQPVEVQRVFTDAPAPAKTAASRGPGRGTEAIIAAAVSAGRIPASRAQYWRQVAASGTDISVIDSFAAVPAGLLSGSTAQDAEDRDYEALFGRGPGRPVHAASGTQASEDEVYQHFFGPRPAEPVSSEYSAVFPTVEQDRTAAEKRAAAAAKATAALSDDELYEALYGKEGSR